MKGCVGEAVRPLTKKAASGMRRTRQEFEPTTASESGAIDEGLSLRQGQAKRGPSQGLGSLRPA